MDASIDGSDEVQDFLTSACFDKLLSRRATETRQGFSFKPSIRQFRSLKSWDHDPHNVFSCGRRIVHEADIADLNPKG